jgi:hypothetical protein
MFGLFGKKNSADTITITDKVVIDEKAKLAALLEAWNKQPQSVIVCWFEDSLEKTERYMAEHSTIQVPVLLVRDALGGQRAGREPLFAEHYPLRSKEEDVCRSMHLEKVTVMQSLGMKETEVIEHNMISSAIKKAQEKIELKTPIDQSARSQEEWIEKNYKP